MRGNKLYLTVRQRETKAEKMLLVVGMREERSSENGGMGTWQGESVSHCLSSLSLRDQVSLIEKKMLKECQTNALKY